MKQVLCIILLCIGVNSFAQKKILDHKDFDIWNTIKNQAISVDGKYIMYSLEKGEKDNYLKIKEANASLVFEHERSENGRFTYDSNHTLFTIKAWKDSITEMTRRKVKKEDMPHDTLGIFDFKTKSLTKIPNVKSYKIPTKWSGVVAYYLTEIKKEKSKDTSETKTKSTKKKPKKVSSKNGFHLVVRDLASGKEDTLKYVTDFSFAKEGKRLVYTTTGKDTKSNSSVNVMNIENGNSATVFEANNKSKYYRLQLSDSGKNLGFVVDSDTTKALVRPNKLYHWSEGQSKASMIVDAASAPKGYRVSSDGTVSFSQDDSKMYFGLATPPIVQDTTLLKDEIVNVEVWTYDEPRLYTVQELQVKNDQKKSYQTVVHLNNKKLVQLATTEYPNARLTDKGNASVALVSNQEPYLLESQWTGRRNSDYAIVDVTTGTSNKVLTNISSSMSLSPKGNYVFGYHAPDSTWVAYNIATNNRVDLTKGKVFYNELNDSPNYPGSYGTAGWTEDDESVLIYDRYDIWKFNPNNGTSTRLTKGREQKVTYRYVRLDPDEDFIDTSRKWLLTTFNENNKHSGYYEFNAKNGKGKQLLSGPYSYSRPSKARLSDAVIFSRQSFEEFPNIRISDLNFKKDKVISNANPQQSEYNWGTAEIVKWTSLDGMELEGMLIKPEDFNPNKKYPMIVNFYEKSSNGVFRHKAPSAGRSTINYSFYASRGYLIFNPDVYYRDGYPGESAYNCVIPGITSLVEKGFVDKDNIGTQGHSWGGYQIAYLVTKTDIFKAAESGAPVVNMISAFGGIRWDSGLSRQFQYEHTQSRIGGTPWEYPQRYVENSPIYNMDKVNTPLLIMHNDKDGHVPWYQGIEYFTALRRLGKPSWLLNYNGARHWPLKMQNRKDFNIRMQQFFDYYLQGAPKPVWMERGVPALEKGINQGLELLPNKN
ncbi:prolyl oligopeptidase family serine peptidase [Flavobacteriaceae bacterium S0825]|uniref:alpha/beta hydrolase family protein n=1 Tax=Gaetbulibacter sp. S0825 TaxID=2720084 RepID=UPI0014315796|nr:prolyl oligopeptidase family serine peptidase [Gaetbulibacter sp. S0825]MCK0109777.1 prolyl oligopeptidase family serine peptidase [Flavobacteriaceae bacterium S0825]NIX65409.1 S9 family peptidase [Gaetbulibacter sp. S0825]